MLLGIWSFLRNLLEKILRNFKESESTSNDMLKITVRIGTDLFLPIEVDPSSTIKDVKDMLEHKCKLQRNDIRIIFAGHELTDDIKVEDCDIGQQSVVHVIKGRINAHGSQTQQSSSSSVSSEASDTADISLRRHQQPEEAEFDLRTLACKDDMKRVHFYVYCTDPCKRVCHGKLRVRCRSCRMATLTIDRDPCCWEDVLLAGRVTGQCFADNCNGKIAEFFFKCANHSSSESESCVALYLIRANLQEVPCLACMEVSNPVLVFSCVARHSLCLGCFQEYCISRLNERRFVQDVELGYTLACPVNCEDSLVRETHHFKLLGGEHYNRYQRFGAEECLLQSGGVLCPQPGCGAGVIPDPECRRVVCVKLAGQGCGFVFCRNCLQGFHIGDCIETDVSVQNVTQEDSFHTEQAQWDEASKVTIKVITKPCPKCRTPTERDGGCMHMVCSRPQCSFHWCWICQQEWRRECMGNHWFG